MRRARRGVEGGKKVVYRLEKVGKKSVKKKVGVLQDHGQIKDDAGRIAGDYRPAGLFPEVVGWMYKQVADVWRLDNEFSARWASYQFLQEHRDLKVVLAAFMLCQSPAGEPVLDGGKVAFHDEDYRDVGRGHDAPCQEGPEGFEPKAAAADPRRTRPSPAVAAINRQLGFGKSGRNAFLGRRWDKASRGSGSATARRTRSCSTA